MQDQVITRIQQARIHVRSGNVERAVALLEQARAMARGDRQILPLILQELVDAYRLVGKREQADLLADELAALAPGASAGEVKLEPIGEEHNSRKLIWASGILGGLFLVALAVIFWTWTGQYYGPAAPVPEPTAQAASPGAEITEPSPAGDTNGAGPKSPPDQPGPGSGGSGEEQSADSRNPGTSREELIRENVGFLLHVGRFQGFIDGKPCQLELPVSSGTCFAISRKGAMLTNKHVSTLGPDIPVDCSALGLPELTRGEIKLVVCMGPRTSQQFSGTVIHESPGYDLAIIKINKTFDRPFVLAGARPRLSQPVYAVGFPGAVANVLQETNADQILQQLSSAAASGSVSFMNWFGPDAYDPTLTRGIVSTKERRMGGSSYIQVDAAISEGHSGGPLLAENNQVVGICSSRVAGMQSYNFALSIPQIRAEIEEKLRELD